MPCACGADGTGDALESMSAALPAPLAEEEIGAEHAVERLRDVHEPVIGAAPHGRLVQRIDVRAD